MLFLATRDSFDMGSMCNLLRLAEIFGNVSLINFNIFLFIMAYFNTINAATIDISENGNNKSNSISVNVLVSRLLSKRLFIIICHAHLLFCHRKVILEI